MLKWIDTLDIAIELVELHPDIDQYLDEAQLAQSQYQEYQSI